LGDELSRLKSMPAVELQVPVFMHMITRQSMLLILDFWKYRVSMSCYISL